jgi:hypothetical protein
MTTRELLVLGHDVRQVQPVYAKPTKMTFEMRMRLLKPCKVLRRGATRFHGVDFLPSKSSGISPSIPQHF